MLELLRTDCGRLVVSNDSDGERADAGPVRRHYAHRRATPHPLAPSPDSAQVTCEY